MAFPTYTSQFTEGTAGTSHSADLPGTSATAGNLLLALVTGELTRTYSSWSAGWTTLYDENVVGLNGNTFLLAKKAAGGETALTFSTDANTAFSALTFEIADWQGDDSSSFVNSISWDKTEYAIATNSYDPPSVSPGSAKDYLWLVLAASISNNTGTWSGSTDFTEIYAHVESGAGCSLWAGYRNLNATSLDPSAVSGLVTNRDGVAFTLAVHPAGASAVTKQAFHRMLRSA